MKNIFIYLIFLFAICLLSSCGQTGENNAADNTNKVATEKQAIKKKKKKGTKKTNGKKAAGNTAYWSGLEKDLGIPKEKLRELKAINTKSNNTVRKLRKEKPEGFKDMVVAKRNQEKDDMKKMLGADLYEKKLAFDKAWAETHSPKVKKKK